MRSSKGEWFLSCCFCIMMFGCGGGGAADVVDTADDTFTGDTAEDTFTGDTAPADVPLDAGEDVLPTDTTDDSVPTDGDEDTTIDSLPGDTGTTEVVSDVDGGPDNTPPAAITDLRAAYAGERDTVLLKWTASGDNDTVGTATAYVLKISDQPITVDNFDGATTVEQSWTPLLAGETESHKIPMSWHSGLVYLALKAIDAEGNSSEISNVLMVDSNGQLTWPPYERTLTAPSLSGSDQLELLVTNGSQVVDLALSTVALSGDAAFSITSGSLTDEAVTLAPGASHPVTIEFKPTRVGEAASQLSLSHDGQNAPSPFTIDLSGVVPNQQPHVAVSFSANPVLAGTSVDLTVTVTDPDSSLPDYDDVETVAIDLSALGGSSSHTLTPTSSPDSHTNTYTHVLVASCTALSCAHRLPISITQRNGESLSTSGTLAVYNGVVREVGTGQSYQTIQATGDGGAIAARRPATIENSVFVQNHSANAGGAIWVMTGGNTEEQLSLKNCLLAENSAETGGGGLCLWHMQDMPVTVYNCTIADNEVLGDTFEDKGGGVLALDGNVTLRDTIIWGNTQQHSGGGDQLAALSPSQVDIQHCNIRTETGDIVSNTFINQGDGFVPGERNNLSSDPLFVEGSYYLQQAAAGHNATSACVDAGSTTAQTRKLDHLTTRADGVPDSGPVDLGYHYTP